MKNTILHKLKGRMGYPAFQAALKDWDNLNTLNACIKYFDDNLNNIKSKGRDVWCNVLKVYWFIKARIIELEQGTDNQDFEKAIMRSLERRDNVNNVFRDDGAYDINSGYNFELLTFLIESGIDNLRFRKLLNIYQQQINLKASIDELKSRNSEIAKEEERLRYGKQVTEFDNQIKYEWVDNP